MDQDRSWQREQVSRRDLLRAAGAGAAWWALGVPLASALGAAGCSSPGTEVGPGHRGLGTFTISLAEWSLHRALFAGELDHLDFPRVAREEHGIDAEGNETHTDYPRMLRIVLEAGYHGHLGIEYEGDAVSEPEGIRLTRALLERVRDELS